MDDNSNPSTLLLHEFVNLKLHEVAGEATPILLVNEYKHATWTWI